MDLKNPVILFDGVCHLCNSWIQFIIKKDREAVFRFASLQSEIGEEILKKYYIPSDYDSVILIEGERFYTKSSAVLQIIKRLKGMSGLYYIGTLIPSPIRNALYRFVASNRYRFFGKRDSCLIPTTDVKHRFLDFDKQN